MKKAILILIGLLCIGMVGCEDLTSEPYNSNDIQLKPSIIARKSTVDTLLTISDNGSKGKYKNSSGIWVDATSDVEVTGTNEYTLTSIPLSESSKYLLIKVIAASTPSYPTYATYKWYKNGSLVHESTSTAYEFQENYTTHDLTLKVEVWYYGVKRNESPVFTYHCVIGIP